MSTTSQGDILTQVHSIFKFEPGELTVSSVKEAKALEQKVDSAQTYLCELLSQAEITVCDAISFLDDAHKKMIEIRSDLKPWESNMLEHEIIGQLHTFSSSAGDMSNPLTAIDTMLEIVLLINKTIQIYPPVSALWDFVGMESGRLGKLENVANENWLLGALRLFVGAEDKRELRCHDLETVLTVERWKSEEVGTKREVLELEGVLDQLERVVKGLKTAGNETTSSQAIVLLETKKSCEVMSGIQLRRRVVVHTAT